MGKNKKPQRKKTENKPEQKPTMALSQKFKIVTMACMVLTAIITCVLLAIFF